LERKLAQGDKTLVANAGYRRFLAVPERPGFAIDPAKVEAEAQFDGLFVLRTSMKLSALAVVLRYRNLLMVERSFQGAKALLATRPVFHRTDAAARRGRETDRDQDQPARPEKDLHYDRGGHRHQSAGAEGAGQPRGRRPRSNRGVVSACRQRAASIAPLPRRRR
jgi:hypothetical protein